MSRSNPAARENGKKGGRPPGTKSAATLEREAVYREYKQKVLAVTDVLFNSQLHLARGVTYLYKIEKELVVGPRGGKKYIKKRPVLVESQAEIEAYLMGKYVEGDEDNEDDPNATYYFLTAKAPDNKAIDSMMDRAYGKAVQPFSNPDGTNLFGVDAAEKNKIRAKRRALLGRRAA